MNNGVFICPECCCACVENGSAKEHDTVFVDGSFEPIEYEKDRYIFRCFECGETNPIDEWL